jgi:hypothetical protein
MLLVYVPIIFRMSHWVGSVWEISFSLSILLPLASLVPDIKGQDQALCRRGDKIPSADFKVRGKKKEKFHAQDPAL